MKIRILSPTISLVDSCGPQELQTLVDFSSYKNTSVGYLIKQHSQKKWLKNNKPDVWNAINRDLAAKYESSVLERVGEKILVKTGFIPYLQEQMNVEIIENRIVYPEPKSIPFHKKPHFELYDYQKESVEKLLKEKHGNVELATGSGKSIILMTLAQRLGLQSIIVVPTRAIFYEMYDNCLELFGENNVGCLGDGKKKIGKRITVCIAKSLTTLKAGTKEYDFIESSEVMLIDEAHTFASQTLEIVSHGILKKVPYRFFMTGTMTRGDGTVKVLQSIMGKTVHEMDTREGIEKRYLCPLEFNIVETFSPSRLQYKDPGKMRRVHFLNNTAIADQIAKIANNSVSQGLGSVLILVDELSQIPLVGNKLEVPWDYAHGNSSDKEDQDKYGIKKCDIKQVVEDFNKGKIKVLIGTSSLNVGVNLFPTHIVINFVGGSSEIDTKQGTIGRSVRKLEISKYAQYHPPKPVSQIYDFRLPEQESAFKKRLTYYKQTGCKINYLHGV